MSNSFSTLCKYEFRKNKPSRRKGKRVDFLGNLLSAIITLAIAVAFVFFLYTVAESYVEVKIDKVRDPLARSAELLNLFYTGIMAAMSIMCLEKMRKTLTEKRDREIFLRLPVRPETIFLSKMTVLTLQNYVMSLLLVLPADLVIFLTLKPSALFWLTALLSWVLLPMIPLMIASVLIIPYIKIVDFVSRRYPLMFVLATGILIGAFWLYSELLAVVQSLLETGSIRFLFNEEFITTLQNMRLYTYPANLFTDITLGNDILLPLIAVVIIVAVSLLIIYFVTKGLFYATLYKNDQRKTGGSFGEKYKRLSPGASLIKKEFISVFRNPGHMFSYFAIAAAMPVMVYCCYTLFESLVRNALGISLNFSLALFIVLVFGVLTNTFCATNITRDGLSALTSKVFPLKPYRIILAKVTFCLAVSSAAVVASCALLLMSTPLPLNDAIIVAALGIVFSAAQIFIATRMDLNNANLASGPLEAERTASKTVAKVVFIGLVLSTVTGLISLLTAIFSTGDTSALNLNLILSYIVPAVIAAGYLVVALCYYGKKISRSFANLVA